jgi:hypothetical protein
MPSTWSPLSSNTAPAEEIPVIPPCPQCGGEDSFVWKSLFSTLYRGCRERRRQCRACGQRFTTVARECLKPHYSRQG